MYTPSDEMANHFRSKYPHVTRNQLHSWWSARAVDVEARLTPEFLDVMFLRPAIEAAVILLVRSMCEPRPTERYALRFAAHELLEPYSKR